MYKIKTRLTALLTVLVLTLVLIPVGSFGNFALALDDDDFEAKVTLDYDALFESAYVINSGWSTLSGTLSFVFRGTTYNETYNAARHFKTFNDALSAFTAAHPNDATTATPVFIFAPGTYSGISVPYNAIILGNNAGMDPNVKSVTAQNVQSVSAMSSGWAAATRKTATTFTSGVTSTRTTAQHNALNNSGNGRIRVVVDGIDFNSAYHVSTVSESAAGAKHYVDMHVQNSDIKLTAKKYVFRNYNAQSDVIRNGLYNVRMVGAMVDDTFDDLTSVMKMDGIYFADTTYPFISSTSPIKGDIDFELTNSFLYNLTHASPVSLNISGDSEHKAIYTFKDNLFYNVGTSEWGMRFYTKHHNGTDIDTGITQYFPNSYYEYNYIGNTFVNDTATVHKTLFNGNQETYQWTSYTMNFNHNRTIGYRSVFPNHSSSKYTELTITADFNYNYYEYVDSHYGTYKGTKSLYTNAYNSSDGYLTDGYLENGKSYFDNSGTNGYIDPFDYPNLIYYTDWAMTTAATSDSFNGTDVDSVNWGIEGFSFYDDVDYIDINYSSATITIGMEPSKTINNATVEFIDENVTSQIYGTASCADKYKLTYISSKATGSTTLYLKATNAKTAATYIFTLCIVANTAQTYTAFSGSGYLYAPAVASLSSGATYNALWDGQYYKFTVGTNVFATIDEIYAKATNPTILIAPGSYGNITLTEACTVKGYNYNYPASIGSGVDPWNYGTGWGSGDNTAISGITIGAVAAGTAIKIQGITLTGAFIDNTRTNNATITIANSVIASPDKTVADFVQFDVSNGYTGTSADRYIITDVRIDSISKNADGEGILFSRAPAQIAITRLHSTASGLTSLFGDGWSSTTATRTFMVTDSRFDNITGNGTLFGNIDLSTADSANSTYTIKNTVVMAEAYTGTLVNLTPACYKEVALQNNIFVNESGRAALIEVDYNNATECPAVTFSGNRVIGFGIGYTAKNDSSVTNINGYLDASGNYFADYSEDFTAETTIGTKPSGAAYCGSYYTDYAMTNAVTTMIIPHYVVDYDYDVANDGEKVTVTFFDVQWTIPGFKTLAAAMAQANTDGVATPNIIYNGHESGTVLTITGSCNLYTPDWDTSPYLKTDKDGNVLADQDGWSAVASNGADWVPNPAFTESVVVKGITISDTVGSETGEVVGLYGFTTTARISDSDRLYDSDIILTVKNLRFKSDSALDYLYYAGDSKAHGYITSSSFNSDSVSEAYFINVQATKGFQRLVSSHMPKVVMLDGVWIDSANSTRARGYYNTAAIGSEFTIKNSNIRNYAKPDSATKTGYGLTYFNCKGSSTLTVNYDNNIFKDVDMYVSNTDIVYFLHANIKYLNSASVTNNYISRSTAYAQFICMSNSSTTTSAVNKDGGIKVVGNVINGFGTNEATGNNSTYKNKLELHDNLIKQQYVEDITTEIGEYISLQDGRYGFDYDYLDYESIVNYATTGDTSGRKTNKIQDMYVSETNVLNESEIDVLNISSTDTTLDLSQYISNPWGNTVEAYMDEENLTPCDLTAVAVPTAGATVYLVITSKDGKSQTKTVKLNILAGASGYTIDSIYLGSEKVNDTHNRMKWRGLIECVGDNATATLEMGSFGGDGIQRFGVIYMNSDSRLTNVKTALNYVYTKGVGSLETINNTQLKYGIQVYEVSDKATSWNEETQSYTYRYNFTVKEGKDRAVVMFAVYKDADGNTQVIYSDVNENIEFHTSTAN